MNPTSTARRLRSWAGACLLAIVVGCGGGVGTGGTGSFATASFASGPITGFGSVIVNGVRFDDSSATVEDGDGVRRSRDDLKLGMTVDIDSSAIVSSGSGDTATATRIRYDAALRGPVASVDAAAGVFTVLGQKVVVDGTTVFAESLGGFATLAPGVGVEVYAVYDAAAARYRAKRVAAAAAGDPTRVRGPVDSVDRVAQTLRIGAATYSYAGASGVPADFAVGQFVGLRVAPQPSAAGRYAALAFGSTAATPPDADGGRLEGLITGFTSASTFSVDGRPVDASAASFPDGRAGLALGVRVEVKGNLRNGTLRATEVKVQTDEQDGSREFELRGAIESVNAAQRSFVLRGQTIGTARADLVYEGGSAALLTVGRRVEVKGRLSADRLRVEATRIKFD